LGHPSHDISSRDNAWGVGAPRRRRRLVAEHRRDSYNRAGVARLLRPTTSARLDHGEICTRCPSTAGELAMNSASGVRLGLLGTRSVVAGTGIPLTGQAVQRHRIALLALLAVSAERGFSREKLLGFLWPESETDNARQLLNQAVYSRRKALGDDAILSHGDDLRLNLDVVHSDVAEFEDAMNRRDYAAAAHLYCGPFLDGFSLGEAQEFEWWVDRERQRLAGAHLRALEALAESAA